MHRFISYLNYSHIFSEGIDILDVIFNKNVLQFVDPKVVWKNKGAKRRALIPLQINTLYRMKW